MLKNLEEQNGSGWVPPRISAAKGEIPREAGLVSAWGLKRVAAGVLQPLGRLIEPAAAWLQPISAMAKSVSLKTTFAVFCGVKRT